MSYRIEVGKRDDVYCYSIEPPVYDIQTQNMIFNSIGKKVGQHVRNNEADLITVRPNDEISPVHSELGLKEDFLQANGLIPEEIVWVIAGALKGDLGPADSIMIDPDIKTLEAGDHLFADRATA